MHSAILCLKLILYLFLERQSTPYYKEPHSTIQKENKQAPPFLFPDLFSCCSLLLVSSGVDYHRRRYLLCSILIGFEVMVYLALTVEDAIFHILHLTAPPFQFSQSSNVPSRWTCTRAAFSAELK